MEFTYNGLVRLGFGFCNPNHAAAFICAIMPFLWFMFLRSNGWHKKLLIGFVVLILLIALGMTFSRTGIIVLLMELFAFWIINIRCNWKFVLCTSLALLFIILYTGALSRFHIEDSASNRLEIWNAGIKLLSMNPISGVGLGNSGEIASIVILPDRINCRTLVNSHLTLIAEFGGVIGFIWIAALLYSLFKGTGKHAPWIAFSGLCVSAFSASIFDWDVLFDFARYGSLTYSNFILSWAMLILFVSLLIYLSHGSLDKRKAILSSASSLFFISCIFIYGKCAEGNISVENGYLIAKGTDPALVLPVDRSNTKQLLHLSNQGYFLPLPINSIPVSIPESVKKVILYGRNAELASNFPDKKLIFVSPPEYFHIPDNTLKIYTSKWDEPAYLRGDPLPPNIEVEAY